jgi:hypothetical protein
MAVNLSAQQSCVKKILANLEANRDLAPLIMFLSPIANYCYPFFNNCALTEYWVTFAGNQLKRIILIKILAAKENIEWNKTIESKVWTLIRRGIFSNINILNQIKSQTDIPPFSPKNRTASNSQKCQIFCNLFVDDKDSGIAMWSIFEDFLEKYQDIKKERREYEENFVDFTNNEDFVAIIEGFFKEKKTSEILELIDGINLGTKEMETTWEDFKVKKSGISI